MSVDLQDRIGAQNLLKLKCASILAFVIATFTPFAASQGADIQVASAQEPQLVVGSGEVGTLLTFSDIAVDVSLTNASTKPVSVDRIDGGVRNVNAKIQFEPQILSPGKSMSVDIRIPGSDSVGLFSHIFYAYSKNKSIPVAKIAVRGFYDWLVDSSSLSVDLGIVDYKKPISKKLPIVSRPGMDVKATSIIEGSDWIASRIAEDGRSVILTANSTMPWGLFDETIVLGTNNELQKRAAIHVRGEIRGPVAPSSNAIDFSIIREGQRAEQAVRFVDQTGRSLSVGEMTITGAEATATMSECVPIDAACRLVKLTLPAQRLGKAPRGTLKVMFPEYDNALSIPFGGSVIGEAAIIRNLNDEADLARNSPQSVSSALQSAVSKPEFLEMPIPEGKGPLLKWEVANETAIYAYELYRSKSETGPFARINKDLILRLSDDADTRSIYRWRDHSAVRGGTYWYYVGVVYRNGRKDALNTAQKVIAK